MVNRTPGSARGSLRLSFLQRSPEASGRFSGSAALLRWLKTLFALLAGNQTITGGFTGTSSAQGTKSSGTFTLDNTVSNFQDYTNGGAHTLAPPANTCTMVVDITNNASAGAITTSGWTKVTGDAFTTTNTNKFRCYISKGVAGSHLAVQAMQ